MDDKIQTAASVIYFAIYGYLVPGTGTGTGTVQYNTRYSFKASHCASAGPICNEKSLVFQKSILISEKIQNPLFI